MVATQAQRSKASRIRRRRKASSASKSELAWLQDYERNRMPRGGFGSERKKSVDGSRTSTAERERTAKREEPEKEKESGATEGDPKADGDPKIQRFQKSAEETEPEDEADDDDDDAAEHVECTIEDCPCKHQGGTYCPNLDKKVYPPMSKRGAQAMSASGLGIVAGLIAFGVRIYVKLMHGKQARWVDCVQAPNQQEIDDLGEDLSKIAMRRANVLGAVDDLLAAGYSTAGYGVRAAAEGAREASATGAGSLGTGTPQQTEKKAPVANAPVATPANGEQQATAPPAEEPEPGADEEQEGGDQNEPVGAFA